MRQAKYFRLFTGSLILIVLALALISCDKKSTSPEDQQVATPVFSPSGGSYENSISVLISCSTAGATIRYTTNGSEPNSNSNVYSEQISINSTTTIKARAFKAGWVSSAISIAIYNIDTVPAPQISLIGGLYFTAQTTSITCAMAEAQIRYTTDGSTPDESSMLYSTPLTIDASMTLKARAFVSGKLPSSTVSRIYRFQVLPPIITPFGGVFPVSQTVNISCPTAGATIYYTVDGSDPDAQSIVYQGPFHLISNTLLKAVAMKTGWDASLVIPAAFQISAPDQMVLVPQVSFHNGYSDVLLSAYYISKYEVTQFDWYVIMLTDPSFYPEDDPSVYTTLPVESISWMEAIAYCNYRSMTETLEPCYTFGMYGTDPSNWPAGWNSVSNNHEYVLCNWNANGYRLPTEMEWMYAARGEKFSAGTLYSGSNDIDEVAWYAVNSEGETKSIGTKLPNEIGIHDMSGNVFEYCWDIFASLPTTEQFDPVGPPTGVSRVMRGGSCLHDEANCTVARRVSTYATTKTNAMGFRVARKGF